MMKLSELSDVFKIVWKKCSPLIKNDELYLRIYFFLKRKEILHLRPPKTFNEKLQWLKLHCDDPKRKLMVDKFEVKSVVGDIIGKQYVIPTLGVWDSFDEIDFDALPDKFVLKCTHDSGGIVICTNKDTFDFKKAKMIIDRHLKSDYYNLYREFGYQFVPHRIIAEEYLTDESGWQLKDYKVFCFNGEPKFVEVDYDRYVGHKLNVYDLEWKFMDFYMTSPNDCNVKIPRPSQLEKMIEMARKLARDEVFVRVDFYSVGDDLYFGELTYYPGNGCIDFHPNEYDRVLGDMLKLPYHNKRI